MNSEQVKGALRYLSAQLASGYIDISDTMQDDIEIEIISQALNEWVLNHKDQYGLFLEEAEQ